MEDLHFYLKGIDEPVYVDITNFIPQESEHTYEYGHVETKEEVLDYEHYGMTEDLSDDYEIELTKEQDLELWEKVREYCYSELL